MVRIFDLKVLGKLYPFGAIDRPFYAFSGGTALQCWLYKYQYKRKYADIDIFAFDAHFLRPNLAIDLSQTPFFIGGFSQEGIVKYSQGTPLQLQITWGSYFDSEIIPTLLDICSVSIDDMTFSVLSPEFIGVSKLSYPSVHRSFDLLDILALNQNGVFQNPDYFKKLLARTSIGKLIDAKDIFMLKTLDDLQEFLDSIRKKLIRRFLYWDVVHVEILNSYQLFVFLDLGEELLELPSDVISYIEKLLSTTTLDGHEYQIAKLGFLFIVLGFQNQWGSVLQDPIFIGLIRRCFALIPERPNFWLIGSKSIFTALRQLHELDKVTNKQIRLIRNPSVPVRIMQKILFDDKSRFEFIAILKSVYQETITGRITIGECTLRLQNSL